MGELVFLCGRDPTRFASGSDSYFCAQALAACLAGYRPHMFVASRRTETVEAPWGHLHRIFSPWRSTVGHAAIVHHRPLTAAIVSFLRGRSGPHIVQAHAGWSKLATDAAAALNAGGVTTRTFCEFYSYVGHEQQGKLDGALVQAHMWRKLKYRLLLGWVQAASVPTERAGYLRADRVAVNYENVRRLLRAAYGERPIEHLAYCAPLAFRPDATFAERPVPAGDGRPPMIIAVSRHSARKGLDVLIRALGLLRDRGVSFRASLVGGGPLLAAHQRLVRSLDLAGAVSFPGVVPDVLPYLRDCELFVLPSTAEDSGSMSVLEALQVGAPIVCSEVDGLPEDLTHERDALLVGPRDPQALADALARLLGDEQLRGRLSRNARATYEARFAPEPAAADLARMYRSLGLEAPAHPARIQ